MLTKNDIKQITEAQIEAQKEVFFTKEEMDDKFYSKTEIDVKFNHLQTSIDVVLKDKQTRDRETIVLNHRMERAEKFLDKAAPKLGLQFKR